MLNKVKRYLKNALFVNHKDVKRLEGLFTDVFYLSIEDIETRYQLAAETMEDFSVNKEERVAATLYASLLLIKDNYTSIKSVCSWVAQAEKRTTVPAGLRTYCKDVVLGYEYLLKSIEPYTDFVQSLSPDPDLYSLEKLRSFVKDIEASLQVTYNNIERINYFLQSH